MAYSASLIAYAFVKKGMELGQPVTQMKLQKMVYFAQGIHLALHGESLIKENIQAWRYGPVVQDIYNHYRFYGSDPIAEPNWFFFSTEPLEQSLKQLDDEAKETIDYTWNTLKNINAAQLSNWTHKDGSPWQKVYVDGVNDIVISNEEIENYFKKYLVQ